MSGGALGGYNSWDDPYMQHQREMQRLYEYERKVAYERSRMGYGPNIMGGPGLMQPAPAPASPNLVLLLLND